MRILMVLVVALLAIGLLFGCGKKQEQTQQAKPAAEQMQQQEQAAGEVHCAVCGMAIDTSKVKITTEYNGKTYYFCSEEEKAKFEANPEKYVKAEEQGEMMHEEGGEHEQGESHQGS